MNTKLGVPASAFCGPLREILKHEPLFSLQVGTSSEIARMLRAGEIQAGFVSPVEYARESSEYRILPGLAVSSRSGVVLCFRKGVRSIETVAADPAIAADLVLAKIILAEEFEISPAIVPVMNCSLASMLARGDSALLSGDAFAAEEGTHPDNLDLAELWSETFDLPYVHGFFCAREGSMPDHEVKLVARAGRQIQDLLNSELRQIGKQASDEDEAGRAYLGRFSYELTGIEEEAIKEFIYYAHCHGVLADIPDLRFYPGSMPEAPRLPQN